MASDLLAMTFSYEASRDVTEATEEAAEITTYSNSYVYEAALEQNYWPFMRILLERTRDFEEQAVERVGQKLELEVDYELDYMDIEFDYLKSRDEDILPETITTDTDEWAFSLRYGREFSEIFDLQVEYDIGESYEEEFGRRGVFTYEDKDYRQTLKTSIKSGFDMPHEWFWDVAYDFDFEQDFLEEDFEYEISHEISATLEKELLRWMVARLEYTGTNEFTKGAGTDEDEEKVENTFTGILEAAPWSWFTIDSKAELQYDNAVESGTGGTVEKEENRKYETIVTFDKWQALSLQGTHAYEEKYTEGLLEEKETTYEFKALFEIWDDMIGVEPNFDISYNKKYDVDSPIYTVESETREWEAELNVFFEYWLMDMVGFMADHSFSYKYKQELDAVLNLAEEADLSEDTTLSLVIEELLRGMTLEFEVTRKATDTRDDDEPMIVDRSLAIKMDWEIRDFLVSSTYEFDDKGDADDTLNFKVQLSWARDLWEVTGEYQYDKTFSEEIDETRRYDLTVSLEF